MDVTRLVIQVDSTQVSTANAALNNLRNTGGTVTATLESIEAASTQAGNSVSSATRGMAGGFSNVSSAAQQAGSEVSSSSRSIQSLSSGAISAAGAFGLLSGAMLALKLSSMASEILSVNVQFENMRIQLESLFNSSVKGAYEFNQAMQLALKSPLELQDVTNGFIKLKVYGIEPTTKVMNDLLEMSARTGKGAQGLTTLTEQLGQAWSKGKLQFVDMKIIMESGVPVLDLLQKMYGKSGEEVLKMAENGDLGRESILKLIDAMGEFASGSQAKAMDTMSGQFSMLADSVKKFYDNLLGADAEGFIKRMAGATAKLFDGLSESIGQKSGVTQINDISDQITKLQTMQKTGINQFGEGYSKSIDADIEKLQKLQSYLVAVEQTKYKDALEMESSMKRQNELAAQATEASEKDATTQQKIARILDGQYKTLILAAAEKYKVSSSLMLSIAEQESASGTSKLAMSGKPNATGDFGLMQINQKTAPEISRAIGESVTKILTDPKTNAEASAYYVGWIKRQLESAGIEPTVERIAASYNAGVGNVEKAKGNLLGFTSAVQTYVKNVTSVQKQLDSQSGVKELVSKKEVDNTNEAVTASEKYLKALMDIESSTKLSDEGRAQKIEQATKAYEDATGQTKAYADALKAQNAIENEAEKIRLNSRTALQVYVEEYQKLRALYDSPANANNTLLSAESFNAASTKLADAKDKTFLDANKQAVADYRAELKKASSDIQDFGGVSNTVFDTMLGGFNNVIRALDNMTSSISDANAEQERLNQLRSEANPYPTSNGAEYAKQLKDEADYKAKIAAIDDKKTQAALTGTRQLAAAGKSLFDQKSSEYKALTTIEQVASAASMAIQAKETASTLAGIATSVAGGVAKMFSQSGWGGFAGAAALLALMAGLGYGASQSGRYDDIAQSRQEELGTGTVLGDSKAKSNSIENNIKRLQENSDLSMPVSQDMLSALISIRDNMIGLATAIGKAINVDGGGVIDFAASKAGFSAGFSAFGSDNALQANLMGAIIGTKKELKDYGITFDPTNENPNYQTYGDLKAGQQIQSQLYNDISKQTTFLGFGLGSKNLNRYREELPADLKSDLTKTLLANTKAVTGPALLLGMGQGEIDSILNKSEIKLPDISLKDLKTEDIQKQLSAAFSAELDRLAGEIFKGKGIDEFQLVGEGLSETAMRLVNGIEAANNALTKFGIKTIAYADVINKTGEDIGTELYKQSVLVVEQGADGLNNGIGKIIANFDGSIRDIDTLYTNLVDIRNRLNAYGADSGGLSMSTIQGAGSIDALSKGLETLVEIGTSQASQFNANFADMSKTFNNFGVTMPESLAAYKLLINSIDTSTEAGQKLQGQLISVAPAMSDLSDLFYDARAEIDALGQMGYVGDGVIKFANDLTASFGSMSDAMSSLNKIVNAFLTKEQQTALGVDYQKQVQQNLIDQNPVLKDIGLYAGMSHKEILSRFSVSQIAQYVGTLVDAKNDPAYQFLSAAASIDSLKGTSAGNITTSSANKVATTATNNNAATLESLQASVTARLKELSSSSVQNTIDAVNKKISDLAKSALDAGGKLVDLDKLKKAEMTAAFKDLNSEMADFGKSDMQKSIESISKWRKEAIASSAEIAKALDVPLDQITGFINSLANNRLTSALKDSQNALKDFKTSISDYLTSLKSTRLGTPIEQFQSVQADAFKTYSEALKGNKTAMGNITSKADEYLNQIDTLYGSSDAGNSLKQQVVDALTQLPEQITVEQYLAANNENGAQIIEELRLLREQVSNLHADSNINAQAIVTTNISAVNNNGAVVSGAIIDNTNKQIQSVNTAPVLA